MANAYAIRITIDGSDVKREAGRVRQVVEDELTKIQVAGAIDIAGLQEARAQMAGLRQDAGALGRAIAQGLSQQWDALEQRLAGLQSQITGIVRAGEKTNIAVDMLEAMPELEQALSANDKKTFDLTLKMQDLSARTNELTRSIAELGRVQVQPLAGGQIRTLSELFKGLSEDYTRGKITKIVRGIDEELAPLEKQIDTQLGQVISALQNRRAELNNEIARTLAEIEKLEAARPPMPTVIGVELTAEQSAWQAHYDALIAQYEAQNKDLDRVRSEIIQGDAAQLRDQLMWRRRELEKPLEEEYEFFREWSMGSIQEISAALRATGQSAAAEALEQLNAAFEERKRLQTQMKRAFGGLQQGGQAELPEGAQGTMVDFVTAERALGEAAATTTANLGEQRKTLAALVKTMDEARRAAEGLNEAERKGIEQLEKAAAREIRQRTPAKVGIEEAAEVEREVLGRLTTEVATLQQKMAAALAEPVAEEAKKQATGLLRLWEWVAEKLVGHSVIPDMVQAINEWLALIGDETAQQNQEQIAAAEEKARALIRLAETETRGIVEAEKRLTAETAAQAKARQAQKTEAARRVTIRQRGKTTLAVAEGRADLKEQERQNKLLGEAQKLAAELGLAWTDIDARMRAGGESLESVTGGLKKAKTEQTVANREAQKNAQLQTQAQQLAQNLGLSWNQVEDAMQASGASLQDVVRELSRVDVEQRQIREQAREIHENYRGLGGGVRLFIKELEMARRESDGLYKMSRSLQEVGNSLKMNAGIVTGAVAVAGRDFLTFAKQSDTAARSLTLSAEMTQALRTGIIEQSAELAVMDAEQTARGVTIWAQATNQLITNQEELNGLLAQTAPITQVAALSQTDIATLSDATAGAINQFSLTLDDTTRVVAIFNKVADETLAEVGDVATGFKYVGPTAERLGETIDTTAAVFAVLGDNAIRGSQAGTAFGRMLENLVAPTGDSAKEFERLFGTQSPFFDAQGKFVGTARAIDMLAAVMEGMNDQQREAALAKIFDVNALRAATVLIREQTQAREQGINILAREAAGYTESALELWETQLADWEQSDVYRVQQAQMRWKSLWLSIGQQGVQLALPFLEDASRWIEKLSATVNANPWIVQAVTAVGGGALAAGTIITAVGTVSKLVLSAQTLVGAYKATILKQESANTLFKTSVVTAAEQFRAIVTQAATQAAGIETTGAATETATEVSGAQVEAGIEIASAKTRAAIDLAAAGKSAGIFVAQVAAGAKTFVAGLGAALLSAGGAIAAGLGVIVGGMLYEALRNLGVVKGPALNEVATVIAYKIGEVVGGAERGMEWAQAVGEFTGALDRNTAAQGKATADLAAYLPVVTRGSAGAGATVGGWMDAGMTNRLREAESASADLTDQLYQQGQVTREVAGLTDEQKDKIVEAYADMLRAQEQAIQDFNARIAQAARDLDADLADLARNYQKNRAAQESSFYQEAAKAAADHQKREAEALANHQKQMQRMREDHEARVWDLTLARDAAGLYKENQQYEKERQRAEQDFADERGRAAQEFAAEQAQRTAQHAQKMNELATRYEEERAQRLTDHAEQVAELQRQHDEEMARIRQEAFDKLNAETGYYKASAVQQAHYHATMLRDAQVFLMANSALWKNWAASLPTPPSSQAAWNQYTQAQPQYQEGGYVRHTVPALVHAGEFVMSARTARQVEAAVGGRLTQQNIVSRGDVTISASFTGVGSSDRVWIEQRLGDFVHELAEVLQ